MRGGDKEMRPFRVLTMAVLGMAALAGAVRADFIQSFAYTDRGVYSGTFTRHTTLNDAQAGVNVVAGPVAIAPTDLSMFFVRDVVSGIGANYDGLVQGPGGQTAQFFNQWFYNPNSNPNNTSDRFVQIDDIDGSTPVSHRGFWTDPSLTQFRLQVSGQNATATPGDPNGEPDLARFSMAGFIPGANPNAFGTWLTYDLDATFDGLNGVLDTGIAPGFYRSNGDPTAINGTFTGVFQMNDQPDSPFFRVDLSISQGTTFGFLNANTLDPDNPYLASTFGSAQVGTNVVPAPPGVILAGVGVVMGLIARHRRRRLA
jgi:hypothetical protein